MLITVSVLYVSSSVVMIVSRIFSALLWSETFISFILVMWCICSSVIWWSVLLNSVMLCLVLVACSFSVFRNFTQICTKTYANRFEH